MYSTLNLSLAATCFFGASALQIDTTAVPYINCDELPFRSKRMIMNFEMFANEFENIGLLEIGDLPVRDQRCCVGFIELPKHLGHEKISVSFYEGEIQCNADEIIPKGFGR